MSEKFYQYGFDVRFTMPSSISKDDEQYCMEFIFRSISAIINHFREEGTIYGESTINNIEAKVVEDPRKEE